MVAQVVDALQLNGGDLFAEDLTTVFKDGSSASKGLNRSVMMAKVEGRKGYAREGCRYRGWAVRMRCVLNYRGFFGLYRNPRL
jgi:hypothetical protein